MSDRPGNLEPDVDTFILNRIDSVPHLEALLLLWRSGATTWSVDEIARRLFVAPQTASAILEDLCREDLAVHTGDEPQQYRYRSQVDRDRLMQQVETAYAKQMIRISNMIHTKASSAVRQFARAFRFTKDQE